MKTGLALAALAMMGACQSTIRMPTELAMPLSWDSNNVVVFHIEPNSHALTVRLPQRDAPIEFGTNYLATLTIRSHAPQALAITGDTERYDFTFVPSIKLAKSEASSYPSVSINGKRLSLASVFRQMSQLDNRFQIAESP